MLCVQAHNASSGRARAEPLRERASRPTEIAVSEAPEAAEEALATMDACVEGDQ